MAPNRGDRPAYRIPPPLPPIVTLVLVVLLAIFAPVRFLPTAVSLVVGIPLLVLGLGLWGWGMQSLSQQGESPDPFKPTNRLLIGGALRSVATRSTPGAPSRCSVWRSFSTH